MQWSAGAPAACSLIESYSTLSEARSRLHQHRFLQPNTHFAAFFKIYKMSSLNFQKIYKIWQIFANSAKSRWNPRIFVKFSWIFDFSDFFFLQNFEISASSFCRSRKMLQNEYLAYHHSRVGSRTEWKFDIRKIAVVAGRPATYAKIGRFSFHSRRAPRRRIHRRFIHFKKKLPIILLVSGKWTSFVSKSTQGARVAGRPATCAVHFLSL